MNREDKILRIQLLEVKKKRERERKLFSYYPDEGELRRELYPKHLEFFNLGKTKEQRLALAANRVGKTEGMGGYEMTLHLTGIYPKWWTGRRFTRAIDAWAAGDTSQTVRDIVQLKLLGSLHEMGTGLIPKENIVNVTRKTGTANAVDTIYVKHVSGGVSELSLKSYDQRREAFQGTKKDIVWLDEEAPEEIYTECLLRTMDTSGGIENGILMLTFTPLLGMTKLVMSFLSETEDDSTQKAVVTATWSDVPHLSEEVKKTLWESLPPFQRDARSKGVPQLGSGAIYPVPETDFVVDDFKIPEHWPRVYGVDVGWNRTAAAWAALDRDSDTVYLYSEYYRGQAEPSIHAEAIKARGDWIPGVIDPAARGRSQRDGQQLLQNYIDLGLKLDVAFNGVESGIYEVWQRLSTGRLKVFRSMSNFLFEFRLYRRDEKGRIVKENDHLCDVVRYLIMSGLDRAKTKSLEVVKKPAHYSSGSAGTGWMS